MGKRRAAEALIKNFILALPSPTEAEIKMSLSATLTVLAAAAKKKAAPSVAPPSSGMPDVVGNVVKVGSTISSATVGKLLSPKPLSKPLIKKGGDAAAASGGRCRHGCTTIGRAVRGGGIERSDPAHEQRLGG